MVDSQFQEPYLEETNVESEQSLAEVMQEKEKKGPPQESAFSSPSDYRQMALNIKRELEREEGPLVVRSSYYSVEEIEDEANEVSVAVCCTLY